METKMDYKDAVKLLISQVKTVGEEQVKLEKAYGRVLAHKLQADENVPAFDRSPYDGYAFRAKDSKGASKECPVTLRITEEIPAGSAPRLKVTEGTAAKILTGAPVPEGADCVIMYEKTAFTKDTVTIFDEMSAGDNIIYAGEDIRKGELLAQAGQIIDAGLAGSLAAQKKAFPLVYRRPVAGIISTGSELKELEDHFREEGSSLAADGRIINTNRYTLEAALQKDGCDTVYAGSAGDDIDGIAQRIRTALTECDIVILTGGVSAGDYDLTPQAMEKAGCELLVRGVALKPGMACCYGMCGDKPVLALSGNPSSSLINYYAVVRPAVRKMIGITPYMPEEFTVALAQGFKKKSKAVRILKGSLSIEGGQAVMYLPKGQGNVVLSSSIGCDVMAVVPAGSGPLEAGTQLLAFRV